MKPDVTINGISMLGLGWLRESIDFPTPQSQSETITVPGRNSPIRYTEALGRVSYQPRSFDITLSMLGSRSRFNSMTESTVNAIAGQLCKVVCNDEPELYAVGTIECTPAYDPLTGAGQLALSCSDGDSYRYHVEETTVVVSGSSTVSLNNDYMPVVPVVTTTADTALSWKVGTDTFQKTVSAGTWEFPELELAAGKNTIKISGTGTTTFRYREGRL
jgi:phage-related protein